MVAFGPALASAPGRMPADTKLALYLDPARLTSEATRTFDAAQYGGWVPHQQIAYLWPTGPWYTAFDVLGVPDWVAHRLWIGTLLALAGIGVGWMLRRLGFGVLAALTGALLYQLSPYVLAYVSRTSSLLLPFAALGWIVGLTSLAIHDRHRVPWRWPVVIGLVVFSIGAPNATALIMIVAAPLAVLGAAAWEGGAERRRALIVGALTTVACTATSLWWVAMLAVQRANGADVLAYSESLRAVSTSSTALETLRGLGYWLFYVRDHVGATTSASLDHLDDGRIVAVGFAAALLPLAGLLTESSRRTRVGAWCVVTGVVVAVGIHPIDDPAPLVGALAGDTDSGLALALRSTARAVPVVLLGAAIGAAALVTTAPAPRRARTLLAGRRHTVAATGLIALAVAATPAWVSADLVDPDLDRSEQPPDSWLDAADVLDDPASATQRVLQIPGAEFGAFEWGVTVDQPLPYLIDRPVLTRDLLPLGSAPTMDLLFALDDRLQDGIAEPGAFGPVARWLGVSHVWLAGDLDVGRYDTARPGVTAEVLRRAALGPSIDLGVGHVPGHEVVDEELLGVPAAAAEIAPVRLIELDQPGSIVRVGSRDVVVVGSGDGLVDAAAAGVLDGDEVVRPALGVPDDEEVEHLVLTDSDRRRAHHWRSSQDVHGFTERADEEDLLRRDDADERLPVFRDVISGGRSTDTQTVAEHDGLVTAAATAYGAPFAHLPEHRPVMAIDGDPATAWTVAEHADPVGERLELTLSAEAPFPSDQLHLRQPWAVDDRVIVEVDLVVDGAPGRSVRLDERSWSDGGQRIALTDPVPPGGTVSIEIAEVSPGRPNGVGIAQADLVSGSITEWIRTPTQLPALLPDGRLDVVLTRLRAESTDRWRDDPEPTLRRRVTLPAEVVGAEPELAITIRLDPRADGATLARLLDDRAVSTDHLLGAPLARGHAAVDDDPTTAWITPFGSPIGPSLRLVDARGTTDRLALTQPSGPYSSITALRVADRNGPIDLTVDRDPARPDAPVTLDLPRIIDLASTTVT
ncbi:MAG: alpha-(1-_3)-arabinofuranosyltransferase family protein, partial [Actinomycetota bacterium]